MSERRQNVDIEQVATGETWYGTRAQKIGLIDEVKTSDEYLTSLAKDYSVYKVVYVEKKSLPEKLGIAAEESSERVLSRWLHRLLNPQYYS